MCVCVFYLRPPPPKKKIAAQRSATPASVAVHPPVARHFSEAGAAPLAVEGRQVRQGSLGGGVARYRCYT